MVISLYIMVVCIVFGVTPLEIIPANLRGLLILIGVLFYFVADHCYEKSVRKFKAKITELEKKVSELGEIINYGER